jgi:diguanylate cyclase (GGDEF)-like protein
MDKVNVILLILMLIFALIALYQYILIKDFNKSQELMEKIKERLYETSEKVLMSEDEDEIYSIVLDTAVDLIPNGMNGSILVMDKNENFHFKVVRGFQDNLVDLILKKEEVYLYTVNEFKETAIIENPRKFDEVNTNIETINGLKNRNALDIYCTISAPIYIDNKLIGLLNVDSSKPGHMFTKKELNLMNVIKSELQIALKNAFAQNKLKYLANFDELTGVMNRRRFNKEFNIQIEKMKKDGVEFSLVMIDLDGFKTINDTYGHNFGDQVLKCFSNLLKSCVRESDVIARLSGDEFIILFRNCPVDIAKERMERITETVASKKLNEITMSFSYGICEVRDCDNITCEEAVLLADTKMYNCKRSKGFKR